MMTDAVGSALALLTVHSAAVTPSPAPAVDPNLVTPGVWGFVIFFAIAVAVVLLVMDMTRRIRRTRYRAEIQEKLDAEERERRGGL